MLSVLDTAPPIRMSWSALAASIGNKARGGHFNSVRKWLIDNGKVIEDVGLVQIAKPSVDAPPQGSPEEVRAFLREQWKRILGGRPADIIAELEHASLSKQQIAGILGCANSGGHWNSAWKALRDNALVVEERGLFRLSEELAV